MFSDLSPLNYTEARKRRDRKGNVISSNSKRHKVTFVDNITNQPLADVIIVESYKMYYQDNQDIKVDLRVGSACCSIF